MLHPNGAPGERELVSLEVGTKPYKVNYFIGETFEPNGMVILGHYSDGTSEIITDYTFEPNGPLSEGRQYITISKNNCSTNVEINVADRIVSWLEVTSNPDKLSYEIGETFDPTGLTLLGHYVDKDGNESTEEVTDYSFEPTEPFIVEGETSITIYKDSAFVIIIVNVYEIMPTGISITTAPTKTDYTVGEYFDKTGMVVTASCRDGTSRDLAEGTYGIEPWTPLTLEDTEVRVIYGEFSTNVPITVHE